MAERNGCESHEEMKVPMGPDQELVIAGRAAELARSLGFGSDPVDEIRIAVIEAVINAIEHSSSPDRNVYVSFGLRRSPPCIEISISDRGGGFSAAGVETPDIRGKMGRGKRKRGWGLHLMKNLMDEVRVESTGEGTRVILIKRG